MQDLADEILEILVVYYELLVFYSFLLITFTCKVHVLVS